jgi:ribosomal-protein-alanine N-acetyltransferase
MTVETERVLLRPFEPQDAKGLFEMDSNPKVHLYLGNKPIKDFEKAKEVVARIIEQHKKNGIARWTAIEKSTGNYMGWSGIKLYQKECCGHINFYEIGYRFKPEYWNKGFATETAKAALDYTFNVLKADTAYGMTHNENLASKRVLEKTGFVKTAEYVEDRIPCFFFENKNPDTQH